MEKNRIWWVHTKGRFCHPLTGEFLGRDASQSPVGGKECNSCVHQKRTRVKKKKDSLTLSQMKGDEQAG